MLIDACRDVVMDICAIPNLSLLATASLDGTVRLWDTAKVHCLSLHSILALC
jgi:WD40 repeat protein